MDEVGFLVQHITANGFLKFLPVGGWWTHNLLAQKVIIKTQEGSKIEGVVASKPPHFLPESQRKQVLPIEALYIDVGASSIQEVHSLGIRLGDPVAPATQFSKMAVTGRYSAKAFDNRVGMAAAIQTMIETSDEKLNCHLIAAGTVQEEVGLRGSKPLSNLVKPDLAIVLEGSPADDSPGFNLSESQGAVGEGVQIRIFDPTAIGHPRLVRHITSIAENQGIRHQIAVRRSGGTDAGSFHLSNTGVPTVVLGTPARYIHSHHSIIDIADYLEMVKLSLAIVRSINQEVFESLTSYT